MSHEHLHGSMKPNNLIMKLQRLMQLLLDFVNSTLEPIGIRINNLNKLDTSMLVMLIGCLGDFFVPLHLYEVNPESTAAKVCTFFGFF